MNKLRKWQIGITLLTSIAYFFYYFGRYNYGITIPFIKEEFGLTNTAVGLMATVLTGGYAIGQFINGYLIDRYGPRSMFTLGGLLSTVANFVVSISTTFKGVLSGWFVNGYVQAFGYPSCCKLYTNWFEVKDRGKALGFNETLQSFSSTVISPLGATIITAYGWRMVYVFPVLPLAAVSLVFHFLVRNYPADVGLARDRENYSTARVRERMGKRRFDWRKAYKLALSDWRMIASYVSYGASQFGRFAIYTWVPAYIFSLTGNVITAGWVVAAFALGGTFGSLVVGYLSDWMEKRYPIIFFGMILSGVSLLFFASTPQAPIWFLSLLMAVAGSGIEAIEVSYFLLPMDILDEDGYQATGVGTMNAFGKAFATVQGVALGALLDISGFRTALMLVAAVCMFGAWLVVPIQR